MLTYRTFRNTDPPAIVDIWRSRAGQPGLLQPVSADLFEQLVFGKLYFDYGGLVLAWDDGRPVGFAHAGFGPNEQESQLSTDYGVTCLLAVRPEYEQSEAPVKLLERCEEYLAQRGAKVLYGGGIRPLNPFYLGLYGGSELSGILQSDTTAINLFRTCRYREIDQTLIFRRDLSSFQAPVDRQQLQIRRQMIVQMIIDPPSRTWWEACTAGDFDLTRFELLSRGKGPPVAHAIFRAMEPPGAGCFVRAAGLIDLEVNPSARRQGMATFLLSEAFASFVRQGVTLIEVQTMAHNAAALALYRKLGFAQIDQGSVFRKE